LSRVGKNPIPLPSGVQVDVQGSAVTVTGPRGSLNRTIHADIALHMDGAMLHVTRPSDKDMHRALHGLTRTLVANMVEGVTNGFRRELEIIGVGYRAQMAGENLNLALGYSHPIEVKPPPGITFEMAGNNRVAVMGIDKEQVGQVAANLRAWRKPEPYKGKGVRYVGEVVHRKAGKSGRTGK
jgi:large subunit ribosomal protein L6